MNQFLCVKTEKCNVGKCKECADYCCRNRGENRVITEKQLRLTRWVAMTLSNNIENWSEKVYRVGEMRRIHNTPRPTTGGNWIQGYEEREDGQLYQTWTQK
jgi:hypothetical protein